MKQPLPSNSGFTLVELTVVVGIIGIISGLSFMTFGQQFGKEKIKASSRNTISWLKNVQSKAIQQNKICEITISKALNTASSTDDQNSEVAAEDRCMSVSTHNLGSTITSLSQDQSNNSDCTLGTENENLRITFTARGILTCGGEIRIISEDKKTTRCINLIVPLGIIREGLLNKEEGACDYTSAH